MSSALITLNMPVLAPIAIARMAIANTAGMGRRRHSRSVCFLIAFAYNLVVIWKVVPYPGFERLWDHQIKITRRVYVNVRMLCDERCDSRSPSPLV